MAQAKNGLLAISSSFTAESVGSPIQFWLKKLNYSGEIGFAAIYQVFQALLEQSSIFATNRWGLNVVLFRWEDLGSGDQLQRNGLQLIHILKDSAERFSVPILAVSCPASPQFVSEKANREAVALLDREFENRLQSIRNLFLLSQEQIESWYPVETIHDAASERLGLVPYTQEYFTALGTAVARKFTSIGRAPYKTAVLDLDNTLWKGVAGEDGPSGIAIDPPRRELQEFMSAQRESGMLLAICSKNNEEDAREVFRLHPEMPLSLDAFAATRVNWSPKSSNLRSLAAELSLGLDSFVFIDDDRKECAEVQANCPEVLTLLLPSETERIPEFLKHVWAFDRLTITAEDRQRNESYRQERQRSQFGKQTASLEDFIAGLELRIGIQKMQDSQIPRVAQLTQRTNQFHTRTIRRTEAETRAFVNEPGHHILTIDVSDRFGDYGLVGALFYREEQHAAVIDGFLLSCRVLGRGVEHTAINYLAELTDLPIAIRFVRSKKNFPAEQFLESLGTAFDGETYTLSNEDARKLRYRPAVSEDKAPSAEMPAPVSGESILSIDYADIANHYSNVPSIATAVREERRNASPRVVTGSERPRNATEERLASIWARTLGLSHVGIHDDFFEIGGTSLLSVELIRKVIEEFGAEDLTLSAVIGAPTVAKFAESFKGAKPSFSCLVPWRATGSREPLFCVHGAGGNVLSLRNLAMNLPNDQPFWCLQAKGLDGSTPLNSVEDSAAFYIGEIKRMLPDGPYYIAGGSYGGLVAYEMARQFRAQGDQVAFLGLFDANNVAFGRMISRPKSLYLLARFLWRRAMIQSQKLLRSPVSEWPQTINSSFGALLRFARKLPGGTANQVNAMPAGPTTAPGDETELIERLNRVRDASLFAAAHYTPGPYEGDVTLFTASVKPVERYEDFYLGWRPLIKGEIDVQTIPGDHITMGDEPAFGHALDQAVARAQAKQALAQHDIGLPSREVAFR